MDILHLVYCFPIKNFRRGSFSIQMSSIGRMINIKSEEEKDEKVE
jgi:hypothetical protein